MTPRVALRTTCLFACVIGMHVLPVHAGQGTDEGDWRRYAEATLPLMRQAPTIDGEVDRAEWVGATHLGPLRQGNYGYADQYWRDVYLGYDEDHLYIAFRLERPREALQPRVPDTVENVGWAQGDFVEIFIDPGRTTREGYAFVVYANGAYGEGRLDPQTDQAWSTEWEKAARVTEVGWEGEVAIPFESIGVDGPPEEGEMWGFDFIDNRRTPYRAMSHWAFRGNWHDMTQWGRLRFGGDVPAVRFIAAGDAGEGEAGERSVRAAFELINDTDSEVEVDAKAQLLRRREGTGDQSYFRIIDGGAEFDEEDDADFEMTTTLEGLIGDALRLYDPVAGAEEPRRITLPAGERRALELVESQPSGEFLALFEFEDAATGTPLGRGATPFRVDMPLALTLEPYWLNAQRMAITADLTKVEVTESASLTIAILDEQGERAYAEDVLRVDESDFEASVDLPVDDMEPGYYLVRATLEDEDGEELARNDEAIERPQTPEWHGNDYGRRMEVSHPWEPLTAEGEGVAEVWGRTYELGRVFPERIISQGHDVLAEPMAFEFLADGELADWEVDELELIEADDGKASHRVVLSDSTARIEGTMTIEFDGFVWYDLVLSPIEETLDVEHARLVMSVPAELAELHNGGELTGLEGPRHRSFDPYYWMGNEEAGVAWIGEGPIDWRVEDEDEVFEIHPPGDDEEPAQLIIHMIDHPVTLDRPMRLQFGLQASPIRPLPEDHSKTHLTQSSSPRVDAEDYEVLAERGGAAWNFHSGWRGREDARGVGWGGWPAPPPTEERREDLKLAVLTAHEHGIKATVYTGWGVKAASEEFAHFGHEMVRKPLTSHGFGTYLQTAGLEGAYSDYMAWAIAQLIKEYDIDGVFWDSTANIAQERKQCENLLIGNGWVDHEGNVHRTVPVRGYRDLFRRIYNLVHGELKDDGVIYNFGGSIWAINAYADVFHRGEGRPMHAQALREAWEPLEYYRTNYSAVPFGTHYLAMNKNFRNLPMTVNTHHAVTLLHGLQHTKADGAFRYPHRLRTYDRSHRPFPQIWETRRWLPMDNDTTWFTYYEDQQVVVPEDDDLLAGAFVSGDQRRAVIVVSNLDQREVENVEVYLDVEGMGLDPSEAIQVEDAIMNEPVEFRDGQTLMLDIEPERFRMLRVWVE